MARVFMRLSTAEAAALWKLAEQEHRDPRQQAAMLVRRGLAAAGLLQADEANQGAAGQSAGREASDDRPC
jgi:hypothetical protein